MTLDPAILAAIDARADARTEWEPIHPFVDHPDAPGTAVDAGTRTLADFERCRARRARRANPENPDLAALDRLPEGTPSKSTAGKPRATRSDVVRRRAARYACDQYPGRTFTANEISNWLDLNIAYAYERLRGGFPIRGLQFVLVEEQAA